MADETKNMSLDEAVKSATKDLETEEEKSLVKEPEVKKEETKEIKKEDSKESDEDDELDPEEAKKAIALLRAINDPATSKEVISILAKQVGLTSESTKQEIKQVEKTLKDMFKESLGTDLEFMSDKLYDAVEKIANTIAESKVKDVRDSYEADKKEQQLSKLESAYDEVMNGYENSSELESEISNLQKQVKIGQGMTPKAYFKMLLITAADNKGIDLKKSSGKQTTEKKNGNVVVNIDKLNKARNDANSRVASERGEKGEKDSAPTINKLSDAINAAIEEVNARAK